MQKGIGSRMKLGVVCGTVDLKISICHIKIIDNELYLFKNPIYSYILFCVIS